MLVSECIYLKIFADQLHVVLVEATYVTANSGTVRRQCSRVKFIDYHAKQFVLNKFNWSVVSSAPQRQEGTETGGRKVLTRGRHFTNSFTSTKSPFASVSFPLKIVGAIQRVLSIPVLRSVVFGVGFAGKLESNVSTSKFIEHMFHQKIEMIVYIRSP
jgi:hypothetical protein